MQFYLFAGLLFGLYCLLLQLSRLERSALAVLPAIAAMALFIGLRDFSIGTDTLNYVEIYHYVPAFEDYIEDFRAGLHGDRMEIGFFLLLSLLKSIGFSPTAVLCTISFIYLYCVALAYKRLCPTFYLGLFVFSVTILFFSLGFNILRQGLASALVILALSYLAERRYFYYFVLSFFAMSFHVIAALGLLIFPFRHFKWQPKHVFLVLALFVCFSFLNVLSALVFELRHISVVFWRVFLYLTDSSTELRLVSWMYLSTVFLITLSIRFVDKIRPEYKQIDLIISFVTIGLLGVMFTQELSMMAVRLGFLFMIAEPILIMALLKLVEDDWVKYVAIFIFASLILVKNVYITAQFLSPYFYT